MVEFTGIGHLHLKVASVERAACFYEEGLGMRRMSVKHDGKLLSMFLPHSVDVLTLSEGAIGAEVDHDSADIGAQGGIDHFGFVLSEDSSLEEAVARLVYAGAKFSHHHDIPRCPDRIPARSRRLRVSDLEIAERRRGTGGSICQRPAIEQVDTRGSLAQTVCAAAPTP